MILRLTTIDNVRRRAKKYSRYAGSAPATEAILSGGMGKHGGNLDTPEICAGSTVYLPVEVDGALLALGDCHAVQSDGELGQLEMRSVVT